MKAQREVTREAFDRLLAWLDPDREKAAEKYEEIRVILTKIFESRGWVNPEDLADETIDRVTRKVQDVADTYQGKPILYFHGVARLVHLEYSRKQPRAIEPVNSHVFEDTELRHECLDRCLNLLTPENRELILLYYQDEKQTKIDTRKEIARQIGVGLNALRIRVHRIRESLAKCMAECLSSKGCD